MDSMTNEVLVDLFTNTPFVGFLIWQYVMMRRDYKEQESKMETRRLEAIQREEDIRKRFEQVISELNKDRDDLIRVMETRLSEVETKIEQITQQVKKIFSYLSKVKK